MYDTDPMCHDEQEFLLEHNNGSDFPVVPLQSGAENTQTAEPRAIIGRKGYRSIFS